MPRAVPWRSHDESCRELTHADGQVPCHIRATTSRNRTESANTDQHAMLALSWDDVESTLLSILSRADSQAEYGGSIPLIRSRRRPWYLRDGRLTRTGRARERHAGALATVSSSSHPAISRSSSISGSVNSPSSARLAVVVRHVLERRHAHAAGGDGAKLLAGLGLGRRRGVEDAGRQNPLGQSYSPHSSPSSMASASIVRGCGPRWANSGSSWLRTRTLTESTWIRLMRSNTRRRWRRSTRPVGRWSVKP